MRLLPLLNDLLAAKRGVRVTILTAGKSDVMIVKLAARYIYNVFLKKGKSIMSSFQVAYIRL
jgi:phosphatidylserine/phosphatidylglycerophosphate/cardiolipin synthase-like enzyme